MRWKLKVNHSLMEFYRTEKNLRERTVLDLGKQEIPVKQLKLLADRKETILRGRMKIYLSDITHIKISN